MLSGDEEAARTGTAGQSEAETILANGGAGGTGAQWRRGRRFAGEQQGEAQLRHRHGLRDTLVQSAGRLLSF